MVVLYLSDSMVITTCDDNAVNVHNQVNASCNGMAAENYVVSLTLSHT